MSNIVYVHAENAHPNNTYKLVEGEVGGPAQYTDGCSYWWTERTFTCSDASCRCTNTAELKEIPGTWCDGYDSFGDHCGRSMHHKGEC